MIAFDTDVLSRLLYGDRTREMDEGLSIEVFSTRNPSEAHLLKGLLNDVGIQAIVIDDIIQAGGAQLPYPKVLVHQHDQAVANAIVSEWKPDGNRGQARR